MVFIFLNFKRAVDKMGFVTVTNNCEISVVCTNDDGSVKYCKINKLEDLKNLRNTIYRETDSSGGAVLNTDNGVDSSSVVSNTETVDKRNLVKRNFSDISSNAEIVDKLSFGAPDSTPRTCSTYLC